MKRMSVLLLLFIIFFISGCWDRVELNDRAIWLATAWDVTGDGEIEVSGQIIIPTNIQMNEGGGDEEPFFVVSSKGGSVGDILENIQKKLPRQVFFGQRKVIIISEEFAKRGLKDLIDNINRTPLHSLRGAVFVVKDVTAKEAIMQKNPLEKISAIAILKEHRLIGGRSDTSYLQFLIAANLNGIRPSLPLIEIKNTAGKEQSSSHTHATENILRIAGVAIFNHDLKLKGLLNNKDNKNLLWILGELEKNFIISEHDRGNASIQLYKISSNVTPKISHNRVPTFTVHVKGIGRLEENNSGLDVRKPKNIKVLEKEFSEVAKKDIEETIKKVQTKYGIDIFGFGEVLHRKHPAYWDLVKDRWDEIFPNINVHVEADLKIKEIGLDGPSILFRRSEHK